MKTERFKNAVIAQAKQEGLNIGEYMQALIELTLEQAKAAEPELDKIESHYAGLCLIIDKEEFINRDARVTRIDYY